MRPLPTLRQLRYLIAVADHRHFGHAADECLVTQSTLSAGIRELEDILGVMLVDRGRRAAALTPAGEVVVARARDLQRDAEALVDAAQVGSQPLNGLLRLGAIPTIAPYLLPRALQAVRETYPDLRLYLREEQTSRVLEHLDRGRLDAALIALPYATGERVTMTLGEDALLVACPKQHPFAGRASIAFEDLAREPLLLLEDGHCLRNHALTACQLSPGQENEDLQATSLATLVQMVASGMGLTLLPAIAVDVEVRREPGIVVVPITGTQPARQIALVWPFGSVRARDLRLFGEMLRCFLAGAPTVGGSIAAAESGGGEPD